MLRIIDESGEDYLYPQTWFNTVALSAAASEELAEFRHQAGRRWRYWLNRRSWKARMHWTRFSQLLDRYPLPPERVVQSIYRHGATV